jgi:RND family efflux transporter MFP subunit
MIRKMTSMIVLVVLGAALAMITGCADKGSPAAERQPEQGQPAVAVVVAPAATANLQDVVDVVGTLAPKFSTDVKSEISGLVTAVYVNEWVPVRKGDRLARLDTSETEAGIDALKAGVAQVQVGETRAKREYERALQLKQYGLITPQNLDDAKSALEAAQAATSAAQAQVRAAETRLAKAFIMSPMDGVVALRGVNVGDRVENMGGNGPMFRIVDNRLLELTVSVPSSRIAAVHVGQVLEFSTDTLPGRTFTGKLMFINPALDESSRSAKVIAQVPNADSALRGGAFVKGRIVVGRRTGVLQVPRDALLNWNVEQQTADVFVVRNNQAEKRTVKTGMTTGAAIEIVSGLAAGDPVVTRGGFALKPGARVVVATGQGV